MSGDRTAALKALISYNVPLEPALAVLASCGWDCDEPLVTLSNEDVVAVLDRYLAGSLTPDQVADWADLLECREDIELAPHLADVLFQLANPSINGPVLLSGAAALRRALLRLHGAV